MRAARDDAEPVRWLVGRSLPYGDGVTFWALGEMIKAQAGILDSDPPERAAERLDAAVAAVLPDDPQQAWVRQRLGALVGLETGTVLASDRRPEAFAAWRRFFEALAESRPLVLVFEDL